MVPTQNYHNRIEKISQINLDFRKIGNGFFGLFRATLHILPDLSVNRIFQYVLRWRLLPRSACNFPHMSTGVLLRTLRSRREGLRNWKPGRLARNTAWATFWQGVRLALQFAYLVLVARALGAEGYGLFSGVVALAASLSPLVGLGFGVILVKEVSRTPDAFPCYWAKAIKVVALSGPIMAAGVLLLAYMLLAIEGNWSVVILIAGAELVAMPFVAVASLAYQAHEQLSKTMLNHVQMNLARLTAIVIMLVAGRNSMLEFAAAYFGATAFAAGLSLIQVQRTFGAPDWHAGPVAPHAREGGGYSLSMVITSAHAEIDKALLLRISDTAATGIYSVASRLISAASIPLITYVLALTPRLFRAGNSGVNGGMQAAWKLFPPILLYGIPVGAVAYAFAGVLPIVFGEGFAASVPLVRMLAALPLLVGISTFLLCILTCSGAQRVRVSLEFVALVFNIGLNAFLIPVLGAVGTVWAVLISQFALCCLAAGAIFFSTRRGRPA